MPDVALELLRGSAQCCPSFPVSFYMEEQKMCIINVSKGEWGVVVDGLKVGKWGDVVDRERRRAGFKGASLLTDLLIPVFVTGDRWFKIPLEVWVKDWTPDIPDVDYPLGFHAFTLLDKELLSRTYANPSEVMVDVEMAGIVAVGNQTDLGQTINDSAVCRYIKISMPEGMMNFPAQA